MTEQQSMLAVIALAFCFCLAVIEICGLYWRDHNRKKVSQLEHELSAIICGRGVCMASGSRKPTIPEAIAAWNTRPAETVNEQMLGALKEAKEFIENLQLPDAEWGRVLDICVATIFRADVALRGPCCREPWCEGDCTCEICAPELAARNRALEAAQKESEGVKP
jgi:hypothetical protein